MTTTRTYNEMKPLLDFVCAQPITTSNLTQFDPVTITQEASDAYEYIAYTNELDDAFAACNIQQEDITNELRYHRNGMEFNRFLFLTSSPLLDSFITGNHPPPSGIRYHIEFDIYRHTYSLLTPETCTLLAYDDVRGRTSYVYKRDDDSITLVHLDDDTLYEKQQLTLPHNAWHTLSVYLQRTMKTT